MFFWIYMNVEFSSQTSIDAIVEQTRKEFSDIKKDIQPPTKEENETQEKPRLGKKIDALSSPWANTYELFLWSKRVGSVVKYEAEKGWKAKTMFMSAERSRWLFDIDANGNSFPNISKIERYFGEISTEDGKQRKITMISTWPTFASYNDNKLAGVNYDNGIVVGTETNLTDPTTSGKWIISIVWWQIQWSHTQEMTQQQLNDLITKQADIMTMSSMKRNGNINPNATLRNHPYGHSLVQFTDGTRWEVILNNCTANEKQQVINGLDISRAVYADADAKSNYLDGIWIQTPNGLKYSHPDNGDLFINENVQSGEVIKDNMPWIIIQYAIQE